ncbi:hypothetical protein PALB_1170 [Pseudoalteromonas luteoviolacea B = ATCC 29581]|nr:hypothetical protein PALB_1170 [Pseudoalteromonas luteoviolacea B = ATCC 29581]
MVISLSGLFSSITMKFWKKINHFFLILYLVDAKLMILKEIKSLGETRFEYAKIKNHPKVVKLMQFSLLKQVVIILIEGVFLLFFFNAVKFISRFLVCCK